MKIFTEQEIKMLIHNKAELSNIHKNYENVKNKDIDILEKLIKGLDRLIKRNKV